MAGQQRRLVLSTAALTSMGIHVHDAVYVGKDLAIQIDVEFASSGGKMFHLDWAPEVLSALGPGELDGLADGLQDRLLFSLLKPL